MYVFLSFFRKCQIALHGGLTLYIHQHSMIPALSSQRTNRGIVKYLLDMHQSNRWDMIADYIFCVDNPAHK